MKSWFQKREYAKKFICPEIRKVMFKVKTIAVIII